ncbi:MAG: alpha/beta fold hydrolase [Vicinamibacterales bacterium]
MRVPIVFVVWALVATSGEAQMLADRRIEAGGTTLRFRCGGERAAGAPMVLFEAGAFNTLETWRDVHAPIAGLARACAHDRPGRGQSGPAPAGLDPRGYVALLAAALRAAGEAPPYILVGHSMGGLVAQLFAVERPAEVAAVVLVDSSHPGQVPRLAGLPRLTPAAPPPPTPAPEAVSFIAFTEAIGPTPPRLAVPLAVLSRSHWVKDGEGDDGRAWLARWSELQRELAATSANARHVVAPGSGHYVQNDAPAVVVEAVRRLVERH